MLEHKVTVSVIALIVGIAVFILSRPVVPYTTTEPKTVTHRDNVYSKETESAVSVDTAFIVYNAVPLVVSVKVEFPYLDAEELVGRTVKIEIRNDGNVKLLTNESTFTMQYPPPYPVATFGRDWTPPSPGKYYITVNPSTWFLMGRYKYEISIQRVWQESVTETLTNYASILPNEAATIGVILSMIGATLLLAFITRPSSSERSQTLLEEEAVRSVDIKRLSRFYQHIT